MEWMTQLRVDVGAVLSVFGVKDRFSVPPLLYLTLFTFHGSLFFQLLYFVAW